MSDVDKTLARIDAALAECTQPPPGRWDALVRLMSDITEQNRAVHQAAADAVLGFAEAWTQQIKKSLDALNGQAAEILDAKRDTPPAAGRYRGGHRG